MSNIDSYTNVLSFGSSREDCVTSQINVCEGVKPRYPGGWGGGVLPHFRAALSLNRVSFLALWSFDRVPKSQALLKT